MCVIICSKPFRLIVSPLVNKAYELLPQLKRTRRPSSSPAPEPAAQEPDIPKGGQRFIQVNWRPILPGKLRQSTTTMQNEFHPTPRTLYQRFEAELPDSIFPIHKSFIIQRKFIDYVEGNTLYLKMGKRCPSGRATGSR